MARKYTILRLHSQILNKGFTLIELIVSLIIFTIVGGLAMNALVESSNSFSTDKKNIDSSQNLSAVLEMIGNDIKQAGEQMNDGQFPVVVIDDNPSNPGSSRITIRRALTSALTLCEQITPADTPTSLIVADNAQVVAGNPNACKVGTLATTTVTRPSALMEARNYRCKLDEINADYSSTTTDFCNGVASEKVRAVMTQDREICVYLTIRVTV